MVDNNLLDLQNRPFATNDRMVQTPPYWRASSLLRHVKLDVPLFQCPSAGIIMSLPSSMADFAPCDRLLQKACSSYPTQPRSIIANSTVFDFVHFVIHSRDGDIWGCFSLFIATVFTLFRIYMYESCDSIQNLFITTTGDYFQSV